MSDVYNKLYSAVTDAKHKRTGEAWNREIAEGKQRRKIEAKIKKRIRDKWRNRGEVGRKEEETDLKYLQGKIDSMKNYSDRKLNKALNAALKDMDKDDELIYQHGKDAPKARSFLTPKSPRKSKSKPRIKRNPTPYPRKILEGAGKHKGGGAVRKGRPRGIGKALRGGGAVTRS